MSENQLRKPNNIRRSVCFAILIASLVWTVFLIATKDLKTEVNSRIQLVISRYFPTAQLCSNCNAQSKVNESSQFFSTTVADHQKYASTVIRSTTGMNESHSLNNSCSFSENPSISPRDHVFQYLKERDIYMYSAFLDLRTRKNSVTIIGFAPKRTGKIYCQLRRKAAVITVSATWDKLPQGMSRLRYFKYKPYYFTCKAPEDFQPDSVSLTTERCDGLISNHLKINVIERISEYKIPNKVLVCMKTLFNFKSAYKLIEFIEFQKILQAEKVIIYGTDNNRENVEGVIDYYKSESFLHIEPWKVPVSTSNTYIKGKELWLYGQDLQIQDCLYRNMNQYKYIVFIDPDEFIFPHNKRIKSYLDIVMATTENLKKSSAYTASFLLSTVTFCLTGRESNSGSPSISTLTKLKRSPPKPYSDHPKSIVNPRRVLYMGVHHVIRPFPGYTSWVGVDRKNALCHHYRNRPLSQCTVMDKTALDYKTEFLRRTGSLCRKLKYEIPRVPLTIN